jgi:hypothetical protein
LIETQACRLVDGARIDAVIVHVDFGARDEEGACLMERIEPAKKRSSANRVGKTERILAS